MNKKKLLKLIYSDKNEDQIVEQIVLCYKKKPAMVEEIMLSKDDIFYHLVISNKATALKQLLENESLRAFAFRADKKGNTLFHKLAQQTTIPKETWQVIITQLPELLNSQNKLGNTPLHEVVKTKNIWAIMTLVNNVLVNQSIKNHQGLTPLALAADDKIIMDALSSVNQFSISPLDFSKLSKRLNSANSIREKFPLLSGSKISTTPTSSTLSSSSSFISSTRSISSSLSSPASTARVSLSSDAVKLSQMDLTKVFNGISLLDDLKDLVCNSKSPDYQKMMMKFCASCLETCLYNEEDITSWLNREQNSREVLHGIITQLQPLASGQWTQNQNVKFKLLQELINALQLSSVLSNDAPAIKPDFEAFDPEDHNLLEMLWSLVNEKLQKGENLDNCLERMRHQAIGLFDKINFNQVLIYFKKLYPQFSQNQKLVANYIVWQFLSYHKLDIYQFEKSLIFNLKGFLRCNVRSKIGLVPQGIAINGYFSSWTESNFSFYNLALIKNYFLLIQWCQKINNNQLSFDELVDVALSKPSSERTKEVSLIANEMRVLSLSFYQEVPIGDFCAKKNKDTPSLIDSFIRNFNQLNNYFIVKILSQPVTNRVNALRLILELAHELCPLDTDYTLDLNHLMLIASVLNTACISRLKDCFNALSPKEQALIKEIERIVSKENNSKWMREVSQVYHSALAFPGNFLTDLTFAKDGNNDKSKAIIQAEVIGAILLKILEIKESISLGTHCHFSDLPKFLKQYQPMNDDDLYFISLKVQPKSSDAIELPTTTKHFTSILKRLDEHYLNNKLIPSVNFHGTTYPPKLLAIKLLKYFSEQVTFLKKSPIDQQYLLLKALNKLKTTIEKLVEVNNRCYYPRYHQEKLNLYYFLSEINKLKKILDPEQTLSKNFSKLKSSKKRLSLKEFLQFDAVKPDKQEANKNFNSSSKRLSFFTSAQADKSEKEVKAQVVKSRRKSWFTDRSLVHGESTLTSPIAKKRSFDDSSQLMLKPVGKF